MANDYTSRLAQEKVLHSLEILPAENLQKSYTLPLPEW
jgi:hypothetical protein